jgi:putative ABC transport system permease protein
MSIVPAMAISLLMLKSYFLTAIRNLWRSKIYSAINISGLSVGLACCMLIMLFAKDEVSFDRFHAKGNRIFHIVTETKSPNGSTNKFGSTGNMPGPTFTREIPEVENFVRIQQGTFTLRHGTDVFDQDIFTVDSNFFLFFSFPLLYGNSTTALNNPRSVVLTEETAKKYFGTINPIGKTIDLKLRDQFEPFVVTAVAKDPPQNSSIRFSMILPYSTSDSKDDHAWMDFFLNTFVLLKQGANAGKIEAKMARSFHQNADAEIKADEQKYGPQGQFTYHLQPLLKMHLDKDYPPDNGLSNASNPIYSYILIGISSFLLLIACINFVNLTIARSLKRAREIGIRKVVGGNQKQLIVQFLGESYIICFFSFLLGLLLAKLLLPFFNELSNKALSFEYLLDVRLVLLFIGLFLVTGLLAGFYPALILSRFNPVKTLYGKYQFTGKNYLSKGLVVFQFTLSTFLIVATITFYRQTNYLTHFNLGYNDKNVVVVHAKALNQDQMALVKNELLKNSSITGVTADQGGRWITHAHVNNGLDLEFEFKYIDENYFPFFQIPILSGRNFSKAYSTDTSGSVMVNEAFVKAAGWKNPIDQVVDFFYNNKKYRVIGVIKNYYYTSLNEPIKPELFTMNPSLHYNDIFMKVKPREVGGALNYIQHTFKRLFPLQPYQYTFKDVSNAEQYASESKWKQIISFSALLTIFISCIGLFGLATLAAEKRIKEIGIRKVLGASVSLITRKLSGDFLILVIIASFIALPLAWVAMNEWLQNYPIRIYLSGWMLLLALSLIMLIALVTVSFQAIRAARANPINSLRAE